MTGAWQGRGVAVVVAAAGLTGHPFSAPLSAPADTMWIQVRTMDGKVAHTVDSLSRLTKVEELRRKIQELFHVEPGLQRLFYRGKQVNPPSTFVLAWPRRCSSRPPAHPLSPLARSHFTSPQKTQTPEPGTKAQRAD